MNHGKEVRPGAAPATAPQWFELALITLVIIMVCFGGVGLLFADLGHYSVAPVFLLSALATVALLAVLVIGRGPRLDRMPGATAPAVGMVLVAGASVLWNARYIAHHVWVERDPGVYAVAGEWLAKHGTLIVPGDAGWNAIAPTATPNSAGMYGVGHGELQFQFAHFLSVLLAEAHAIHGDAVMFRLPALLGAVGLCAVYAVGCRVVGRPWLVLAAVAGLAVSMPQLSVSRDTYSETTTQIALWGGILLLLRAYQQRRLGTALLAGLAVGATVMTRIDGVIYLLPVPVLGAVCWLAAKTAADRRQLLRLFAAFIVGVIPVAVLGTIDVRWRSRLYYQALRSQVVHLYEALTAAVVVAVLLALLWPRLSAARTWIVDRRSAISTVVCWLAGGLLILAWSLRPALQHPVSTTKPLGTLEASEGLTINPYRTLGEQSMVWISWYIGPVALTLAIAGICVLIARTIRSGSWAPLVVLLMAGGVTAIYIDNPSISADQIFAMRRFVPGVLPLFVVAAAVAIGFLAQYAAGIVKSAIWPRNLVVAGSLALVAFPLATTLPVGKFQTQANYVGTVTQTCKTIGPNAAVLFPWDDLTRLTMPQTIRSFCNVPAASLTAAATDAQIHQIAAGWKAQGRTLWVLSSSPTTLAHAAPLAQPAAIATATSPRELEVTIAYAPQAYTTAKLTIYAARINS